MLQGACIGTAHIQSGGQTQLELCGLPAMGGEVAPRCRNDQEVKKMPLKASSQVNSAGHIFSSAKKN